MSDIRIHIDSFRSNSDEEFDDLIPNIEVGMTPEGVVNMRIETREKYVYLSTDSHVMGLEYSGDAVQITPIILDPEGGELIETDMDAYFNHPDFYQICLVLELPDDSEDDDTPKISTSYTVNSTALKHEYMINFVPDFIAMNTECMEEARVIEWIEE